MTYKSTKLKDKEQYRSNEKKKCDFFSANDQCSFYVAFVSITGETQETDIENDHDLPKVTWLVYGGAKTPPASSSSKSCVLLFCPTGLFSLVHPSLMYPSPTSSCVLVCFGPWM